jgi:hypothetical protein
MEDVMNDCVDIEVDPEEKKLTVRATVVSSGSGITTSIEFNAAGLSRFLADLFCKAAILMDDEDKERIRELSNEFSDLAIKSIKKELAEENP